MIANILGILIIGLAQASTPEASRYFPPESGENRGKTLKQMVAEYGRPHNKITECDGVVFYQWQKPDRAGRPCLISCPVIEDKGLIGETYFEGEGCKIQFAPIIRKDCGIIL